MTPVPYSSYGSLSGGRQSADSFKRRSFLSFFSSLLLVLACIVGGMERAQAQNYAGSDVTLHGVTFTYDSSGWNGQNVDYYYAGGSGNGNPAVFSSTQYSGVATVSHSADGNAPDFSGYWTWQGYTDAHVETSISDSVTVNNHSYWANTRSLDYSLDSWGQLVSSSTTVYGNSSDQFITVQINSDGNGSITGYDSGFILANTWYVNTVTSTWDDYRSYNGGTYIRTSIATNYAMPYGSVETSYVHTYLPADSGTPSGFTVSYDPSGFGTISGNVTGYVINGTWYVNTTGALDSPSVNPPSPLFGRYYSFSSGTFTINYQSDGSSSYSQSATFMADGVASLTISYNGSTASLSGNDPSFGSFSATYNGSTWSGSSSRTSPTFAPSVFYNPSTPVRFRYGSADFDGHISDTYTTDDGSLTVVISGNSSNTSSADVYVNGAYGTYSGGSFNVSGYDFRTSQDTGGGGDDGGGGVTVTTRQHTSGGTYWVNGHQLNWNDGSDTTDSTGFTSNSTDNYGNPSTGDYMSISTVAPAPGEGSYTYISVTVGGVSYSGSNNSSTFQWTNNLVPDIQSSSPTIAGGPPAYLISETWSGGQYASYYVRAAPDSQYYSGPSGRMLKLSGSSGSFQVQFQNANDPYGYESYSFSHSGQAGVFTVSTPSGTVLAYTADNYSIQIPGNTPPSGYPPAIYVPGAPANYAFVGTAPDLDDPSVTDAYYVVPELGWWGSGNEVRMLKIRLSDNTVVLGLPNIRATPSEGIYDPQTHLFLQDPVKSPLPMPMYGVDPLNNNLPWQLPTPPSGFPSTALVNGEYWHFVSVDENGVLHYVGDNPGQTMTLAPSSTRAGVYDVVLTNPYNSSDTGEFHNFTFTMEHGTQVISGTDTGSTINPQNIARQSIAGDIDIFGNVLSLGSLRDDPDTAGLTMSFGDDLTTSSLSMALARPSSSWTWSHPGSLGSSTLLPAMKLNAQHRLGIYSLTDASAPAIMLDPAGVSNFKADVSVQGTLRVKARGDLGMGSFTNGPQP